MTKDVTCVIFYASFGIPVLSGQKCEEFRRISFWANVHASVVKDTVLVDSIFISFKLL